MILCVLCGYDWLGFQRSTGLRAAVILTLNEHDHQEVKCPKCGSKNVEQEVAAFFAVTSKKS